MAQSFSLSANVSPTVDEQAAEREGSKLADSFEEEIGDLSPGVDSGGVSGLGGARGGLGGGGNGMALPGGGTAAAAAGGGLMGGALKRMLPALLAGGAIAGVAKSSPAMKQVAGQFGSAMSLFFRPFGNFLSTALRPASMEMMNMAIKFNELYKKGGLKVAINEIIPDINVGGLNFKPFGQADWFKDFKENFTGFEFPTNEELGLTESSLVPNIPDFSWPSLPNFNWPSLPNFSWPSIPNFSWPGLPDFDWPSLPSFNWPNLPDFSWPNVSKLWNNTGGWPNLGNLWDSTGGWGNFVPEVNWGLFIPEVNWPWEDDTGGQNECESDADCGAGMQCDASGNCVKDTDNDGDGEDERPECDADEYWDQSIAQCVKKEEAGPGSPSTTSTTTQSTNITAELDDSQMVKELKKIKQNTQSGTTELDPFTNTGA